MKCYDVSEYERHQWRFQKLVTPGARAAEHAGEQRWSPAFGRFAEEVFHRLVAEAPQRCAMEPGAEVWDRLHREIDVLPEVEDLRARCTGDEDAAGIAVTCVLDTLTAKVADPDDGPLPDPAAAQEARDALERLIARSALTPDESMAADAAQADLDAELTDARMRNAAHAANMDGTDIRDAVRAAVKAANQQLDEREQAATALSFGRAAHSGRQERQALGREAAKIIKDNARMRRIAQLAGRLKAIAREQQARKPTHGADEYTGVELGNTLERLLPAEWAAADDPDLETWFHQRYLDAALQQIELAAKPKKDSGPIVILLDSSGSMSANEADVWAAAVTLAFLDIAVHQRRACAILSFGSTVLRHDYYSADKAPDAKRLVESVCFFAACGGTSFDAALTGGMDVVQGYQKMKDADIVMITDGYSNVRPEVLSRVNNARREDGLHVYSILIGMEPAASINQQFSDETVSLGDVLKDDAPMHGMFGAV
jgi:uncharacterized protein with von Willebrand factor type A (vWA) domain